MPDTDKLDAQIARKQGWGPKDRRPKSNRGRRVNRQLSKLHRKRARQRDNATHQVSHKLADTAHTVAIEDLNTKAMTKSAKGTVAKPGRQVKQTSGLNRSILASDWGSWERKLAYKAEALLQVDPAYTSQTCSRCGHVHGGQPAVAGVCSRAGPAGAGPTPNTTLPSTFWCGRDFRPRPWRPAGQGLLHGEGRSPGGPR